MLVLRPQAHPVRTRYVRYKAASLVDLWRIRVLYSPPHLTTGIQWIQWIPVDFWWIQQDYIIVIKKLQIYPVDLVDFQWIVVDFW